MLSASIWILIPLTAIIVGALRQGFKQWLQFKAEQRRLGSSAEELEKLLGDSRAREETLAKRLENLETIVTSRVWDAIREDETAEERAFRIAESGIALSEFEPQRPSPQQQAAELASRLNRGSS